MRSRPYFLLAHPSYTANYRSLAILCGLSACLSFAPCTNAQKSHAPAQPTDSQDPCAGSAPARDYWKPDGQVGDLAFYIPGHWKKIEDQGFTMLVPTKGKQREVTRIGFLPAQAITGDGRQLFETIWAGFRQQFNTIDNGKPEVSRTGKGLQVMSRYSRISSQSLGNGTFTLDLVLMGKRAQPYFYLSNADNVDFDNDFQTVKNTLERAKKGDTGLPQPGVPCGLSGIFAGLTMGTGVIGSNPDSTVVGTKLKSQILVFFPDGNVISHLPEKGLENFDFGKEIRQSRDSCGRYRMIGDNFKVTWADNSTQDGRKHGGGIEFGGFTLAPAANTDGLKLSGIYRGDRAPTDARIKFTSDGHFVENGILDSAYYSGQDKSPGSGTYTIQQNTLDLHYSTGRNVALSFYVFASDNTGPRPKLIHLNTYAFVPAQ